MKKFLKWTGILLSVVVLVVVIGFALLVTFVSPNSFKPLIAEQVKKTTGRQIKLDGNLAWTIYPTLGVKSGHIALNNPEGFNQPIFAEIDSATVGVKLLPLLHGAVESTGVILSGVKLNLIKNAAGKTNWEDLQANSTAGTATSNKNSQLSQAPLALAVAGIDITNSSVTWTDEATNNSMMINSFEFHAKNISFNQPFPISSQFNFTQKNPEVTGKMVLTGQLALDVNKQIYQINNFKVISNITQKGKSFDANTTGDAVIDMTQQTLNIKNFNEKIANLTLNGKMSVTDLLTTPHARGHVNIPAFDLKKLLQAMGQDAANLQAANNVRGDVDFTASKGLDSVSAQGDFSIATLRVSNLNISNVSMQAKLQNSQLNLTPITADLYQGKLQAKADVNLASATPQITMDGKLINVQSEPLMHDLKGDSKISVAGAANIDWKVTTSGADGNAIVKNLNGNSHLEFANGAVKGIDLGHMIDSASALLQKQQMPSDSTGQTNFGTLTANATITNGVIKNNDLFLDSPRFDTKGSGTIDLVNQNIDYKLQSTVKQAFQDKVRGTVNLQGLMIPIFISGNLNNPHVRLDTSVLLAAFTKQQMATVQQKVQKKIKSKLQDQLGDQAQEALKNLLGH